MPDQLRPTTPDDVVEKVLRRAEVAKMARKLRDRLALANYKAQRGQEALTFKDLEARLEHTLNRKRPGITFETSSTSSSCSSDHLFSGGLTSSPLTAPMFLDHLHSSGNTRIPRKRNIYRSTAMEAASKPTKRVRSHSMAPPFIETSRTSWKSTYNLPESSPVYRHQESRFSTSQAPNVSFASETSTVPDSPPFGHVSEEDTEDVPAYSFQLDPSHFQSSPPRTPPPTRNRQRNGDVAGEEGADLLLYLATSPSPAKPGNKPARIFAPSTPPSTSQALPSSMLGTPGMTGFNTPGQQFNFADFVNVTPSPAQGAFSNRTPGLARTPLAAREARRKLNFDTLMPPGGSPNISNLARGSMDKDSGLGMELGGELVS